MYDFMVKLMYSKATDRTFD